MSPEEAVAKMRAKHVRPVAHGRMTKGRYASYLSTPQWKARAAKVHKRAKGMCEGCGTKKSREVHHLSYAHVGNEFLFELVALCEDCHDRWHTDKK